MKSKQINISAAIIPSIDIFLLIAIFIFLSGNFLYQSAVKIELPPAVSPHIAGDNPIVTLTPGGAIFLNGRKVSKEGLSVLLQLTARLSTKKKKEPLLIIRADKNALHQQVVEIIGIARNSGMKRVAIASEPPK